MGKTTIEWSDQSWPVINGCRRISPGCGGSRGEGGCYAERLTATRLRGHPKYEGLAVYGPHGPKWTGKTRLWERDLLMPIRLRKASRIFVADMGDLFYEGVSNEQIAIVFGVMAACPQHIFQVLTKRADRMRAWFEWVVKRGDDGLRLFPDDPLDWRIRQFLHVSAQRAGVELPPHHGGPWPLRNVHLGVSVENQEYADKRIPQLLKTPAAVRFISAEPLLERVDISIYLYHGVIEAKPGDADFDALNWVIVGGESGPGARPFDVQWARRIVDDCAKAGVACFVKQLGANAHDSMRSMVGGWTLGPDTALRLEHKKGSDITEFPSDLRVRQFPEAP